MFCPFSVMTDKPKNCNPNCKFYHESRECLLVMFMKEYITSKQNTANSKQNTANRQPLNR